MFEALQAHPTLFIIVIAFAYLAGGATMLAAIGTYVIKTDPDRYLPDAPQRKHRMEIDADRDKIAEAVGVMH